MVVVGASGNYQDMQPSYEQKQVTESCGMSISRLNISVPHKAVIFSMGDFTFLHTRGNILTPR